ncbi:hypothetical protein JW898_01000 [Candidatus Woesearchaeota archaeon]|nr:hypothetical protein [Candidatus Woesearchaeota archaeon]
MVKEKTLLQIALAVSVLGTLLLFLLSQNIEIDQAMLNRLDDSVDESVIVTGSVVGISQVNSTTFLRIQKDEIASVVLFGKTPYLEVGDFVQVRGKVTEHDGETGLIGEEVRVI